jgi:hypothetical protein
VRAKVNVRVGQKIKNQERRIESQGEGGSKNEKQEVVKT